MGFEKVSVFLIKYMIEHFFAMFPSVELCLTQCGYFSLVVLSLITIFHTANSD